MSLVDVRGYNFIPGLIARVDRHLSLAAVTLDADGELCGAMVYIPKTGNISKIGIRIGTVTTTDTLKVSIQGVDASNGRPDDIIAKSGTLATPASNTTYWVELSSVLAVTVGQKKTIVVEFNDFVGESSDGNLGIVSGIFNSSQRGAAVPYNFSYTGGSWALNYITPNFGIEYDDGTIESILGCWPAIVNSSRSWDMNDNPDRCGLRFQVPYACRLRGAFFVGDIDTNASLILYDSDGTTILETVTFDGDVRGATGSEANYVYFTSTKVLTKDTYYRLIFLPTTGTNISIITLTVTDDGANKAMNAVDGGIYFHLTICNGVPTDESDWTQTLTQRPITRLVVHEL